MIPLTCTVRRCGSPLVRHGDVLRCPRGHAFDRAREGYWNLLQPQDRRAANPGDRGEAVEARRRWLDRGMADGLVEALVGIVAPDRLRTGAAVLDVGCGEGTFVRRLFAGRDARVCGIDLSAHALRLAARRMPEGTWIVANADRGLPLPDQSVDLALSFFGRRPLAELARVIGDGGRLIVVVPGEDDLIELREHAQGRGDRRDRAVSVAEEMASHFTVARRRRWRTVVRHDRAAIADALAMTYRGARRSERSRLESLAGLDVTLAAEILEARPSRRDGTVPASRAPRPDRRDSGSRSPETD